MFLYVLRCIATIKLLLLPVPIYRDRTNEAQISHYCFLSVYGNKKTAWSKRFPKSFGRDGRRRA